MKKTKFIFIFIDGVGIGPKCSATNPFTCQDTAIFPQGVSLGETCELPVSGRCKAIDANLGVEGHPQSATGQSTLFTGTNTSQLLGQHLYAFPNKKLRALLMKTNILKSFQVMGKKAIFFNAYPFASEIFNNSDDFNILPDGTIRSNLDRKSEERISVTTTMAVSIRQKFLGLTELLAGQTVYQDFSNKSLQEKYPDIPIFSAAKAGAIIGECSRKYDLLLYEYFITDKIGHEANIARSKSLIVQLEEFIKGVLGCYTESDTTVVITSDHGNLESTETGLHTRNPVPLLVWGRERDRLCNGCGSILDVTPAILECVS